MTSPWLFMRALYSKICQRIHTVWYCIYVRISTLHELYMIHAVISRLGGWTGWYGARLSVFKIMTCHGCFYNVSVQICVPTYDYIVQRVSVLLIGSRSLITQYTWTDQDLLIKELHCMERRYRLNFLIKQMPVSDLGLNLVKANLSATVFTVISRLQLS